MNKHATISSGFSPMSYGTQQGLYYALQHRQPYPSHGLFTLDFWLLRFAPFLLWQTSDWHHLVFYFGIIGYWLDLFLIPGMDRQASMRFHTGRIDYNVAWILLTFLGVFGVHRMYQGKWITGILYLCTGGFFLIGVLYDFWTMNQQISIKNQIFNSSFQ